MTSGPGLHGGDTTEKDKYGAANILGHERSSLATQVRGNAIGKSTHGGESTREGRGAYGKKRLARPMGNAVWTPSDKG